MQAIRRFFIALQFFTCLPIPRWVGFEADWLRHAAGFFPLVGLLIGALTAGTFAAAHLWLPLPVAVALSMAAGAYLTRAMHEDGFADVCDGFGGGWERDRVLAIMKDSCVGSFGLVGMLLLLGLKFACLTTLPVPALVPALLLAHPVSRFMATILIWRLDYARPGESKARAVAQHMSGGDFALAVLSGLLPALALAWRLGLSGRSLCAALALALLATLWLVRLFLRRIGGYTGDCLGAVQQVSEVAIYLGLLATLTP
ncbi:adenosylcobinamide-GDP ribazoletransferase [Paludibacterium purpuratum]|uniref:Adenosylcobinamide-GDP ribazoletransferase n=1 Tax=Paludibacterium purpuratum TaxID=1144873 RepID=A0A4R7B569_9NEIS|nr:adenosylcobinamide-GDP ribazoletransferase [Paludibacterium purpuratum]TDR79810.1 cobalamin-5'-phosphate synthase [Paludibacterium purpuratum]